MCLGTLCMTVCCNCLLYAATAGQLRRNPELDLITAIAVVPFDRRVRRLHIDDAYRQFVPNCDSLRFIRQRGESAWAVVRHSNKGIDTRPPLETIVPPQR